MNETLVNAGAVLVAALLGLLGLWFVNSRERAQRSRERSRYAFTRLMAAIGSHASECIQWLNEPAFLGRDKNGAVIYTEPRDRAIETGGPSDVELQTIADITIMESHASDRAVAMKVADLLYQFKRALTTYRIAKFGELVGDIRKWSTGKLSEAAFFEKWDEVLARVIAAEEDRIIRNG